MPATKASVYNTNVLIGDGVGTAGSPGSYFGFGQSGTSPASTGPRMQAGTGNPTGVVTSPLGSRWTDTNTGITYSNTDGATSWQSASRLSGPVALNDQVTAVASAGAYVDFATTCTLPANFFGPGTAIRIEAKVRVANASGTVTLQVRVRVATQVIVETTAVDPTNTTDFQAADCDVSSFSAASAASPLVATSSWATGTGSPATIATGVTSFDRTNFATNAAIVITVGALWSGSNAGTSAILEQLIVTGG